MGGKPEDISEPPPVFYCSFCGKNQHEVRTLIAAPLVFICDECVEVCNDIIAEQAAKRLVEGGSI